MPAPVLEEGVRPKVPAILALLRRPRALLAAALLAAGGVAIHLWMERSLSKRFRGAAERLLGERLPGARLGDRVTLDWQGRIVLGPLEVPARGRDAPPVLRARIVRVRPRWGALLRGRAEPSSVTLAGVDIELGQEAREIGALLDRPARTPRRVPSPARPVPLPEIRIEDATISAGLAGGQRVALGPFTARVAPAGDGVVRADASLEGTPLSLHGLLRWDARQRRAVLEGAWLSPGRDERTRVDLWGEVQLGPEPRFSAAARLEPIDYAALLDSLPADLVPEEGPRLSGPVSARLEAAGPLCRPSEWAISADLDLSALRRASRAGAATLLQKSFAWRPEQRDGEARPILVGPENPDFVAVADLPPHVIRAVTTSEDAGFFAHQGFDFEELRNALAEGAGARRLRGASTITQQVAKNLFLTRERTLARKLKEALLTVALEATLPKARILEIYLNVAEWGPGIHGIGEAARHWFGKDARALSPREAAFLATVLPSPSRAGALLAGRGMPDAWRERIDGLLLKMRAAGQLDDDQLREALRSPLAFASG